jgi:hypothetical protein
VGRRPSPRRTLNPALLKATVRSDINKNVLSRASGFADYSQYYTFLHSRVVPATPLLVRRLVKLAELIGFPANQIFIDEGGR